jgi:dTMP kinase
LGTSVRRLVLGDGEPGTAPVPRAELLLLAADRAQHVEETIRPALAVDRWVVTDRFSGSTLAYQGKARGMALDEVALISDWAAGGVAADLTVLLDLPVEAALERRGAGGGDRLERLGASFQEAVRQGYRELAEGQPERWVVVDAARSIASVASDVIAAVEQRLGPPPGGWAPVAPAEGGGS